MTASQTGSSNNSCCMTDKNIVPKASACFRGLSVQQKLGICSRVPRFNKLSYDNIQRRPIPETTWRPIKLEVVLDRVI